MASSELKCKDEGGTLLDFLKRLDRKVTIRIRPHKPREPYQEVGVTTGFTIQMQVAHQFKKVHRFVTDH